MIPKFFLRMLLNYTVKETLKVKVCMLIAMAMHSCMSAGIAVCFP